MSQENSNTTVNRAKMYQLALFPMNNGATNVYYVLILSYIATFGNNVLSIATLFATSMITVMRVFDGLQSYYVNRKGKRMSATAQYHVDVPVVQGHFNAQFSPVKLLPLIDYVNSDESLSALVTMYSVRDSNNVYIVPCILGHVVNIGHIDNLDNKFAKLREFYTKVMPEKGWLYYDTISLKFSHQVVATRRVKAVKSDFDWANQPDEADADIETMMVSDSSRVISNNDDKKDSKEISNKMKKAFKRN